MPSLLASIITAAVDKQALFEFQFHPRRKWRFDIAWPDLMLAVEIDGGIWSGGRHTRRAGFHKDMEKINAATVLGWRVLRFTPQDVEDGYATRLLEHITKRREAAHIERDKKPKKKSRRKAGKVVKQR